MKSNRQHPRSPHRHSPARPAPAVWSRTLLIVATLSGSALAAAETNGPPALTPEQMFEGGTNTYANWIEFSTGGFITSGNKARFQQQHQAPTGPYGGIEDFHYLENINKTTTLAIDGRALFDEGDYKLSLDLEREKTGYLKFNFGQFRTWYGGDRKSVV